MRKGLEDLQTEKASLTQNVGVTLYLQNLYAVKD